MVRHRIDLLEDLVRRSAKVRDEDLIPLADSAAAKGLFEEVVSMPIGGTRSRTQTALPPVLVGDRQAHERRTLGRHRLPKVAIAAAIALAVVLSVPAFGVVQHISSWLSGSPDWSAPQPTAADIVIASGTAGKAWHLVATPTNEGLCVFIVIGDPNERNGLGGCGPSDVRGDPSATGPSLHWVRGGSMGTAELNRIIFWGEAAEEVGRVELELANGDAVSAHLVDRPEGIEAAPHFFWAELGPREGIELREDGGALEPQQPLVHAILALDEVGNVLERRIVDQPRG